MSVLRVRVLVMLSEVDVPSTWTALNAGDRFSKVELDASSDEFKRVEQNARATCQNSLKQIIKVVAPPPHSIYPPFLAVLNTIAKHVCLPAASF